MSLDKSDQLTLVCGFSTVSFLFCVKYWVLFFLSASRVALWRYATSSLNFLFMALLSLPLTSTLNTGHCVAAVSIAVLSRRLSFLLFIIFLTVLWTSVWLYIKIIFSFFYRKRMTNGSLRLLPQVWLGREISYLFYSFV